MESVHYLEPYSSSWIQIPGISREESLGANIDFFDGSEKWFNNLQYKIIIVGIPEDRNGDRNRFCSDSPDAIRKRLYGLRGFGKSLLIGDAGNVKGKTVNDRYHALQEILQVFSKKNIPVIALGGTQDLTVPLFEALNSTIKNINLAICDAMIDLDVSGKDFSSAAWLNKMICAKNQSVEDITFIGTQNYLISPKQEEHIDNGHFEILRLGDTRGKDIEKAETVIRDSHILSFDFRAIAGGFAFDDNVPSPHGIEPFEACKICHYAGLSDKLLIFGLFEVATKHSSDDCMLPAQMIWHFIEGVTGRYSDFPLRDINEYTKYIVRVDNFGEEIIFYNNSDNGRWWLEVPIGDENKVVSCSHDDYIKARRKELPEKWWRLFIKNKK